MAKPIEYWMKMADQLQLEEALKLHRDMHFKYAVEAVALIYDKYDGTLTAEQLAEEFYKEEVKAWAKMGGFGKAELD